VQRPKSSRVDDKMIAEPLVAEPLVVELEHAGHARVAGRADRSRARVDAAILDAFETHAGQLTAFALATTRDRDEADDVVAEAFVRLVRTAHEGPWPDNVGGWLHRVAANLMTSRGRHLSVVRRTLAKVWEPGVVDSLEATVIERESSARIQAALARQPRTARIALLMAAQGHDMATIGAAIGRTPTATRTFVCRARVRLRETLEAEGPPTRPVAGP
jgi:DNA-directed RNA polymerase specialized sigma24 family protein